jgi:hypothetical protein
METQYYLEERIKFNIEIIKLLGLIFLATVSGVITVVYQWGGFTGKNFVLAFFGLVLIFALGGLIYNLYRETSSLIEKLK